MNWTKIKFLLSLLGVSLIMSTTVCSCVSNTIATPQITDTIQTPETDEKTTSTPTLSIKKGNLPFTPGITPTFETFEEINLYNNDMLIFVTDFFTQQNFILNLKNNIMEEFTVEDDYVLLTGWSQDGCDVIGRQKGNNLLIDLDGNVKRVISRWSDRPFEDLLPDSISPTGEWATYIHGYGYQNYTSYEFQDLITVSIANPTEYYQLTSNGGATETSWDPTGNFLAYTDYDTKGIQQLYISQPNGSGKMRLTAFVDNTFILSKPLWSPFGDEIALQVSYSDDTDVDGESIQILSWESESASLVNTLDFLQGIGSYWWHDANTLAVDGNFYGVDKANYEREIRWMDIVAEDIRYRLNTTMTGTEEIAWPKPIGSSIQIGFFARPGGENWFHIYDITTNEIIYRHNIGYLDLGNWFPEPLNFLEKEKCLSK